MAGSEFDFFEEGNSQQSVGQAIDPVLVLIKVIRNWPVILISLLLGLLVVFMYHRYTMERYAVRGSIMIPETDPNIASGFIREVIGGGFTSNFLNELEVLRSKEIRVAFVGEVGNPSHNTNWINHLVEKEGIRGIVLTRANQNADYITSEILVFKLMQPFPYFNPFKRWNYIRKLKQVLSDNKIDLIHFLWGVDDCVLGPILGKPFVITTRGSDVFRDLANHYFKAKLGISKRKLSDFYKSQLHLKAYKLASAVTSTSKGQIEVLKNFQRAIKNSVLVRTGLYTDELIGHGEDFSSREKKIIFSPRTMRSLYNQDIIIKAFAAFKEKHPDAELRMIDNRKGSSWSKYIRKLINTLCLEKHVILLPSLNEDELYKEYKKASVCIMIPKTDGVPVTGLESMLMKTPLIVGSSVYDDDIFNDQTVWQLNENSEGHLYDKLLDVFASSHETILKKTAKASETVVLLGDRRKEMMKIVQIYRAIIYI